MSNNNNYIYPCISLFDNESMSCFESISFDENQDEISQNFDVEYDLAKLFWIRKEVNTERTTNNSTLNKKKSFKAIPLLKYYSVDEINELIKRMNLSKEIEKKILLDKNKRSEEIEAIWAELTRLKKRRRNKEKEKSYYIKIQKNTKFKEKPILGRKRKGDNTKGKRNKYDAYNIIKKIKVKIIHYLLLFINSLIQSFYTKEQINEILFDLNLPKIRSNKPFQVIKKIGHDIYSKKTKRDDNLQFLSLTVAEYLSNITSKKYKNSPPNSNKLIISSLLKDEDNKDIFDFIFNKFDIEKWLDILLNIKDLSILAKNFLDIKKIIILKEHLKKINSLLLDISSNDENYYYCFTLLLYNLKEYFAKKEGRNRDKKIKNQ